MNNYSKKVRERFLNPLNMGEIKDADAIAEIGNTACGDIMKIYMKIDEKKGEKIIKDIKFQTMGCAAAIASSDILCDLAKGKRIEEAKKISDKDILDELNGLPKIKEHCSLLGAKALKKAIEEYEGK
jgi:NifU-like protein involved in Fe-S cluster formation